MTGNPRSRLLASIVALALLATLVMLVATPLGHLLRPRAKLVPARVVVAPFENDTGRHDLDVVGPMTADWIAEGLTRTGVVEVVQPATTLQLAGDSAIAPRKRLPDVRFGEETGAATVVAGSCSLDGDSLVFQTRLIATASGRRIVTLDPVRTSAGTPLAAIEIVRRRVMAALAERVSPALGSWTSAIEQPPAYESYRAYVEGLRASVGGHWPQALQEFQRASTTDSAFYGARLHVGLAWLNLGQPSQVDSVARSLQPVHTHLSRLDSVMLEWLEASRLNEGEDVYRVSRDMSALEPASLWVYQYGLTAMLTNHPGQTIAALSRIDPQRGVYRGWSPYWETLTAAEHMRHAYKDELRDALRGRRQYPALLSALVSELRARAALGDAGRVWRLADRSRDLPAEPGWSEGAVRLFAARELRAHNDPDDARRMASRAEAWYEKRLDSGGDAADSSGLAMAFYLQERWSESRALFAALVASRPDQLHYMGYIGTAAARLGDRPTALVSMKLLERAGGDSRGIYTYWRADIAALLGERDRALALLREARDQGNAIYFKMHSDPDLESLRGEPAFVEIERPRD